MMIFCFCDKTVLSAVNGPGFYLTTLCTECISLVLTTTDILRCPSRCDKYATL